MIESASQVRPWYEHDQCVTQHPGLERQWQQHRTRARVLGISPSRHLPCGLPTHRHFNSETCRRVVTQSRVITVCPQFLEQSLQLTSGIQQIHKTVVEWLNKSVFIFKSPILTFSLKSWKKGTVHTMEYYSSLTKGLSWRTHAKWEKPGTEGWKL